MSFLEEEPLSTEDNDQDNVFSESSRERVIGQLTHLDTSHIAMNLPGPSGSSDIPGPSTRYPYEAEMQRITELFCNNDHTENAGIPAPRPHLVTRDEATNAIRVLFESTHGETSTSGENEDDSEFLENHIVNSIDSREPTDSTDHLFAPEESSSSSMRIPPGNSLLTGPRTQNSALSYFKYLSDPQGSVDELPSLRTSRHRRFFRLPLSVTDHHRDCENRIRSQRLLHRSRILNARLRMRFSCADLLSRHKTSTALNAVTPNEDGESFTSGRNELRDFNARPYRRNFFLPKPKPEARFHPHITPSESSNHGYYRLLRPVDRSVDNRSPALQNHTDLLNSPRPTTSNVRARSVSPISTHSNVSASIHDEPLDDIGINLQTSESPNFSFPLLMEDFENVLPRPSTPLPPLSPSLSDIDTSPSSLSLNNIGNRTVAAQLIAAPAPETCQSVNSTMNESTKMNVKEAPRTYDDLNNELIQLLECPICFEYATPPISQCLQGHIICHTCRQRVSTCPTCRTVFQESRNLIMEKVAALLRYPCRNAVTGCPEFLYLLQKMEHEKACGFRQFLCFLPFCTWRGYKPELLVHVQAAHENHVVIGPSTNLMIPVSGQTKKVWLMSAFNELFYVIFFTTLSILKGCVRFIGDSSKCENFAYNISVTSEDDMLRNFNYTRMTHAYEENSENSDLIDSYDLFSISHAQLNLFRKGTKAPVRVTIEEIPKRGSTTPASSNAS